MTGKTARSWSWLHSIGIPALLVIAEATWVSLLIDAVADTSKGPHVDVPFLAVATPAAAAVVAAGAIGRTARPWWRKVLVLIPLVAVGASVTAATLGLLTPGSGSWWRMASQPWSVSGHTAATVAGVAWFGAALTWGRGIWAGVVSTTFRTTVWSFGLGAVAFAGMFLGTAERHAAPFRAATRGAGWLFFLWFPLCAAVIALVREGELEKQALSRVASRPTAQWLAILTLPMLGVALIALALAVVIGPGAPVIGRAVARIATAVWDGIVSAARWLWNLIPTGHSTPTSVRVPHHPRSPSHLAPPPRSSHALSTLSVIIVEVVAAVIVVAVIVYLARNFRPLRYRWKSPDAPIEDEIRDSLFSWHHLASQIWGALLGLSRRLRRPRRERHLISVAVGGRPGAVETVRQAYRRVLQAARASGCARQAHETTQELRGRLSVTLAAGPSEDLDALTHLYDTVRYGEVDLDELAQSYATSQADNVAAALHREEQ